VRLRLLVIACAAAAVVTDFISKHL
jgi:hypothetical protein